MPISDGLIPPDEQAVYRKAGHGRCRGFGTRPALLVVDVEYNFIGEISEPVPESIAKFKDSCGTCAVSARQGGQDATN